MTIGQRVDSIHMEVRACHQEMREGFSAVLDVLERLSFARAPSPSSSDSLPAPLAPETGDGRGDSFADFDIADYMAEPEPVVATDVSKTLVLDPPSSSI